jgi:hypothetical protein
MFPLNTPCKNRNMTRDENCLDAPKPSMVIDSPRGPNIRMERRPIRSDAMPQNTTVVAPAK